jgi:hypothetical protein
MNIEEYVNNLAELVLSGPAPEDDSAQPTPQPSQPDTLEAALKGLAVELWCDATEQRFWLVADEDDAQKLGEARGAIYSTSEARLVIQIDDPKMVAKVHAFKREFNTRFTGMNDARLSIDGGEVKTISQEGGERALELPKVEKNRNYTP